MMTDEYRFRPATEADLDAVAALYRVCAANAHTHGNDDWAPDEYPNRQFAQEDLAQNGLFVLEKDGEIISAVSLLPHGDLDGLDCWTVEPAACPTRLCVRPDLQGRHIAQITVEHVLEEARRRGCKATRHLSLCTNVASDKLYRRMGFIQRGTVEMYEFPHYCFEYIL